MNRVQNDVLELTKQLIAMQSHKLCEGREAAIGRFLVEWFTERGIEAELQPVVDGRSNVIARIPGGDGPSVMLCGHLDTVPAGDMADAFAPRMEEGVLRGRGACDMKGAVAAMCCAIAARAAENAERSLGDDEAESTLGGLAGDLVFLGTVDEETGGLGVQAAMDSGLRTDFAIVGEPTNLRVTIAHKGACFVRITLTGRGAHGSCPEEGVSAVSHAARIVRAIEEELRPKLANCTHALLGCSTVNVGRVSGGTQPNIVAEHCEIDIDRRTVPGDGDPVTELKGLVSGICDGVEGLSFDVAEMPMTSVVPHTALETQENSPLAQAAMAACREAGLPADPVGVTYWTDGGHLAANGIETIILGPGDIADAHGPRDRVREDHLTIAVALYRAAISALRNRTPPSALT